MMGEASPNSTYLGLRLVYTPGEDAFDPISNHKYLVEVLIRAFVIALIWLAGEIVLSVGGLFITLVSQSAAIVVLGLLANLAWCAVLACVFWFAPLPAIISEWKLTIDGKGAAAPSALDHIAWVLERRGTPLKSVTPRELKVPGQPPRVYLQIREGLFTGFISCFDFGDDLYIGWTFWVYMSPARWCLHVLSRILQNFRLRGSALYVALRYDTARATREAMHSAVREGVDVAAGRIVPAGQGTVGDFIATRPDPMNVG
ncbi:MAG: hypothetical protein ACXWBN_01845 [Acidimicrobiales bacterium]